MDGPTLARLVGDLHAAVDELQAALQPVEATAKLQAAGYRALERRFDEYLTADKAFSDHVESVLRHLAPRPR